jgi:UDP-4-amino-4,6-dideoxy-N-acetyl-beta-L-altrosamine transaminase
MIPYGKQDITEDDIAAVVDVLRSDYLTQGPAVPEFEHRIAAHTGTTHAVAVNSATSALHVACLALGLGPGDWLWTSPITFVASANCGLYCGAKIDFVDIDPRTYNMSPLALEEKLLIAEKQGRLPKIVVPVHLCGQSCEMQEISELGKRFGFHIIEDASHAIGGRYRSHRIGSCRYSDISVFSFHPVKIITTAEGGMALTNDSQVAERMARLRSHGITRDPGMMTHAPDGPWYYQQIELGFNYRLNDLQAALGISQLKRLDDYIARRHQLAERYDELLPGELLTIPWQHPDSYSARHLYVVRLNTRTLGKSHREIFEQLKARGIGVNLHYIPVHAQPYYQELGFSAGDFPEAEDFYREAVSLPLYPAMSEGQQDQVIEALYKVLQS